MDNASWILVAGSEPYYLPCWTDVIFLESLFDKRNNHLTHDYLDI